MTPDQIREQIRYHMREIERLQCDAAVHQQLIDGLSAMLWEFNYDQEIHLPDPDRN